MGSSNNTDSLRIERYAAKGNVSIIRGVRVSAGKSNKALQRTRISAGCLPWRYVRAAELSRYVAEERFAGEMILATSRLEAPRANRERTRRSNETEGSPASILATLD